MEGFMPHVFLTVVAYLFFNLAIWLSVGEGGLLALAGANALGATITLVYYFRKEVKGKGSPKPAALIGAIGILLIVIGLRQAHATLPVSLSMEAVYNGFAIGSWPMFVALAVFFPTHFTERPNRFDLACHFVMAILVAARFLTYGNVDWNAMSILWVVIAILGYAAFNIGIKLGKSHRATNITMNFAGAGLVLVYAIIIGDIGFWEASPRYLGGLLLGGAAIFGIVRELGSSYSHFGAMKKGSLVAALVYDGILVLSPTVMIVTGEWDRISVWTILVGLGMLGVTVVRYQHHMKKA